MFRVDKDLHLPGYDAVFFCK